MCVLVSQCGRESRGILEGQHSTSPLTGIEKVCDEMFTFIDKLSGENIDLLAASLHSSSSETVFGEGSKHDCSISRRASICTITEKASMRAFS